MLLFLMSRIVMEEAKDGGGGGGDPLFGGGENKGAAGGGDPAPKGGAKIEFPQNWKDALPDEIKNAPFMQNVADVPTLAKNFANAQKLIGADKIPVPGQHSSKEEWAAVFQKLGLPKALDEYKFDLEKDVEVDQGFLDKFKAVAHQAGVLPSQAKMMADFFGKNSKDSFNSQVEEQKGKIKADLDALKKDWGQSYDEQMAKARAALNEFTDPVEREQLKVLGLGHNTTFLKLLAKFGGTLAEGKIRESGDGGGFSLTPSQARAELDAIKSNVKHPYYVKDHEGHVAAKQKVRDLYAQAFSTDPIPSQKRQTSSL